MDLTDLLDIVRNEKLYTKRIEELQNAEANAKAATERLIKAKDIDAALVSAKSAEQIANKLLKESREKYLSTVANAESTAIEIVDKAKSEARMIADVMLAKKSDLDALTQQLDAVTKQIKTSQREIANANAELARVTSQSSDLREQIQNKQQQLRELLAS